jgi:DNA-binding IclR family transcriptional regulator
MAGNSAEAGRSVTSKVIAILLAFAYGNSHTLTEIARLSRLPISTVHRLVRELAACGVLEHSDDGQYRVGEYLKLVAAQPTNPLRGTQERTRRVMEDLAAALGHADVRLGVLAGHQVVFIHRSVNSRPTPASGEPAVLPVHATATGKALLAFAPPAVVDDVIARGLERYTRFTITDPDELRRALATIRLTGVAVARRELQIDTISVAAPVFAGCGEPVAAIELRARDYVEVRLLRPPLIVAARTLSRELAVQGIGADMAGRHPNAASRRGGSVAPRSTRREHLGYLIAPPR